MKMSTNSWNGKFPLREDIEAYIRNDERISELYNMRLSKDWSVDNESELNSLLIFNKNIEKKVKECGNKNAKDNLSKYKRDGSEPVFEQVFNGYRLTYPNGKQRVYDTVKEIANVLRVKSSEVRLMMTMGELVNGVKIDRI